MKKIKVLHMIKTLNLGGAETNLYNLSNAIDKDRFEVHVAYSYGGEMENKFKECGVKLFKYANRSCRIKSFSSLAIVSRLIQYLIKNQIDIIHTHIFNAHIWGLLASKLTGKKIVEHVHDFRYFDPEEYKRRYGFNRQYGYVKYLKNLSDAVIVLTEQNHNFLVNHKLNTPNNIRQIKNGIPLNHSTNNHEPLKKRLRNELGLEESDFVILTSSRISAEKNIGLILRVAPKVIQFAPQARFVIAGNGPLLEEYTLQIQKLNLQKAIRFIGYHPNIEDLLTISQMFLLPSFLELHSISLLEAMNMKVPVLISKDVGCHNEFVKNWENGVLLNPFSDNGWAETVIEFIKNPNLLEKMGGLSHQTCEQYFDIKNTAKEMEDLYVELLSH